MYREKASEPLIDTETGVTFVALPFLHFKDTHKFDITMDKKVLRLSCHKIFDSEFQSKAHLFGDFATVSESAPIYAVHYIDALSQSGERMKMSGPERKAAFDDVLPLFGKMLLQFRDTSALFIAPSFHEDYFKSFAELQTEALTHQLEWAHTYIVQSRMLMKHFNLDSLAKVRATLRLDPEPGDDEGDFEDRIEAAIESFAPDKYFIWLNWAEQTVDSVIADVQDLLSSKSGARNMKDFLFADLLQTDVDFPEQDDYVAPRLRELQPELLTSDEQ